MSDKIINIGTYIDISIGKTLQQLFIIKKNKKINTKDKIESIKKLIGDDDFEIVTVNPIVINLKPESDQLLDVLYQSSTNEYIRQIIKEKKTLILDYCVKKYLSETPIGGKTPRHFEENKFLPSENKDVLKNKSFDLIEKILFKENIDGGDMYMKEKDIDDIGLKVIKIFMTIDILKRLGEPPEQNKFIENDEEFSEVYNKHISKSGYVCKDKCKIENGGCKCNVDKYIGYFGEYTWDYCDDTYCNGS